MKKVYKNAFALALMALFALPAVAQLNGTGYYRVHNAQNTSNYISIANDKLKYSTIVNAGGGAKNLALNTSAYAPYAFNCVDAYLRNDIHMVATEFIDPATIIYAKKIQSNDYNLIGQGTSLLTLTTGMYDGANGDVFFKDLNVTIQRSSGSGASTLYTASILLKATATGIPIFGTITKELGTRYFVDNNGIFAISESGSATNAKWYIEPLTYFNVSPEVVFNGKYYTTLMVPFECTLGENVEKAYVITSANNGILESSEITGTIPAGTPVLLQCGSPNALDCKINLPASTVIPKFPAPRDSALSAPSADLSSNYAGVNMLRGTYFCNNDNNLEYVNYNNQTLNLNTANLNVTSATNPQKYIIGITESGKLGFVKASGNMPINKAWLELSNISVFPTVATPTISPIGGTYNESQTVRIQAEDGATIYYTTDGTTPTTTSAIYSEPFTVDEGTTTVKAIAIKQGLFNDSEVATAEFVIETPITALLGDVNGDGEVNISDVTVLIDYLLGDVPDVFIETNADMDGNQIINISDVTQLIDYLLNE